MRLRDLSRRADLPPITIQFYLRSGLLPPPTKVNRTRAEYGEDHVLRLSLIKRLRREAGLPIAVIRRLLGGGLQDERLLKRLSRVSGPLLADMLVRPDELPSDGGGTLDRTHFLQATGLSERQLALLETKGLLGLMRGADGGRSEAGYGEADVAAGRAFQRLLAYGLREQDLALYQRYRALASEIAERLYPRMFREHGEEWLAGVISGRDLAHDAALVETYVRYNVARELFPEAVQQLAAGGGANVADSVDAPAAPRKREAG